MKKLGRFVKRVCWDIAGPNVALAATVGIVAWIIGYPAYYWFHLPIANVILWSPALTAGLVILMVLLILVMVVVGSYLTFEWLRDEWRNS